MYYGYNNYTMEDITVTRIDHKLRYIFKEYERKLVNISQCRREDSIIERTQALNTMEDTATMLIAYAKAIAKTDSDKRVIVRITKRYERLMCVTRDAILIG